MSSSFQKFSQNIPLSLKLQIRSLGWQRVPWYDVDHSLHYMKINFFKAKNLSSYSSLPQDVLLKEQFIYEQSNYSPYRHQESIIEFQIPTIVEPLMGGVIIESSLVIEECYALPLKQPVILPILPVAIFRARQAVNIPKAILLRHPWGDNNYFHFYNDILSKLALLHELDLFSDYPIIVSKKLYDTVYFRESMALAKLEDKSWIIQSSHDYLRVDQLVVIRAHELTNQNLHRNLQLLKLNSPKNPGSRKIFLTRSEDSPRKLVNRESIIEISMKLGFEIIDCGKLSLLEQIDTFANSRIIVGEHGAGFSNIIYRCGHPLEILELFPPYHISTCYFVISLALGYHHNVLRSQSQNSANYEIESALFREKLEQILDRVSDCEQL